VSTTPTDQPSVSVIIAWVNSLDLLLPGLDAVMPQLTPETGEIIIATRHGEALRRQLHAHFPDAILLPAAPSTPITTLRSMGLKRARGAILVVTEDHCTPGPHWIAVFRQTMADGHCMMVGGPVDHATPARWRDWAAFLTDYAGAVPPAAGSQDVPRVPGNNIAYRRELRDDLCHVLDQGVWESFYQDRLAARGVPVCYVPELVIYHRRPFGIRYFLAQRFHFCRAYAAMRLQSLTRWGRMKYAVGSLLLPPLLLLRGFWTLHRRRRYARRYLACLPLIALYVIAGAAGEMQGYLFGGHDSLRKIE
jgi:hypothetical protein